MSLYVDGTDIERVFVNGSEVHKLFCNGEKVWAHDIEYVGSVSTGFTGRATKTMSLSGIDVRAGDFMLAVTGNGSHTSSPIPSAPSGFTSKFYRSGGSSSRNAVMRLSYRIATGTETSISYYGNYSGTACVIHIYRYVDTVNPFDVSLTALSGNTYTNNINPKPITPATQGALIVASGVAFSRSGASASLSSNDLSSFKHDGGSGDYYGCICGMGYRQWDGSGSYDPTTWSFSGDTGGANYMTATVALRPKY